MSSDPMVVTDPGDMQSSMKVLKEWIDKHGCKLPFDSRQKETHMSLFGGEYGRLLIPDELHESWLQMYTQELLRGAHSLFFTERRTPIFKMHFDLDFTQPTAVTLDDLKGLASHMNQVFRRFYPSVGANSEVWSTAILCAPPKWVKDEKGNPTSMIKSGCHLIWPWLFVDQATALQLRLNVVAHLKQFGSPRPEGGNPYEDVVDETVLKSNGLRMYGSDKAIKCKKCKGRKLSCSESGCMRGVVVENRAYTLQTSLNPDGTENEGRVQHWRDNLYTCIRFTSTRTSNKAQSPGFVVPSDAITDSTVCKARKAAHSKQRQTPDGLGPMNSEIVDPSCPIIEHLQNCINNFKFDVHWVDVKLKSVFLMRNRGVYICKVEGPGSLYCQNACRAHTSSTIYFEVSQEGIYQRCFSPKTPLGKKPCKTFKGIPWKLNRWLNAAMFGDKDYRFMSVPTSDGTTTEIFLGDEESFADQPWKQYMDPDFPGMTFGEVERLNPAKRVAVKAQCLKRLPDPKEIHLGIIKGQPMPPRKRIRKK